MNQNDNYMYARQRRKGYEAALNKANLPILPQYQTPSLSFEDGRKAIEALLHLPERPDAIFAVSDTLAIGAIRGLHDAGLSVPGDVAVIGFDNLPFSTIISPQLTTIAQPMRLLGETAATLLLEKLRNPQIAARGLVLDHQLIIRESA